MELIYFGAHITQMILSSAELSSAKKDLESRHSEALEVKNVPQPFSTPPTATPPPPPPKPNTEEKGEDKPIPKHGKLGGGDGGALGALFGAKGGGGRGAGGGGSASSGGNSIVHMCFSCHKCRCFA